jgi:hypothetical protein
MKRPQTWVAAVLLALGGLFGQAQAAVLIVDDSGPAPELQGATGIDIDGTLYDVEFLDGTCVGLFDGCNEPSDFAFTTQLAATTATQFLLAQVFIDVGGAQLFDTDPELTRGCSSEDLCNVAIPYEGDGTNVAAWLAHNVPNNAADGSEGPLSGSIAGTDFASSPTLTYAVFSLAQTSVPAPAPLGLLGAALLGLALGRRHLA